MSLLIAVLVGRRHLLNSVRKVCL